MLYLLALLFLNIFSFLIFYIDKIKARNNKYRISEFALLLSALIAPFGAIISMNSQHHKTKKLKFKLVYLFLIIHLIIIFKVISIYYLI